MTGSWIKAALIGSFLTAGSVAADSKRIEGDEAKKLAGKLIEASSKLENLPLKITPDAEKCVGLGADKRGAFLVPDSGLKLDALKNLDKEIVPLGMLYTHRITLVVAEQSVPAEQQRTVEISVKNANAKMAVMQLAAARVAGRMVLLVYTNGKSPAQVTTLVETEDAKDYPLDLDGRKSGDNQATLVVTVLGRYRASISVGGQD